MYALKFCHPEGSLGSCYFRVTPAIFPLSSGSQIQTLGFILAQTLALSPSWDTVEDMAPPRPALRALWFLECHEDVCKCRGTFPPCSLLLTTRREIWKAEPSFQWSPFRNHICGWVCRSFLYQELYEVEMAELIWQGSVSQTASSQIPEVRGLGSPQHVLFNKHSHTWPFTLAALSLPSQRLELSTLALAPQSLGSAFQF